MRRRIKAELSAAEEDAAALVKAIRDADRWARAARLLAYLVMVTVTLFGFWKIQNVQDADCHDRRANREALRESYIATANLGEALVANSKEPGKSRAVAKFKAFRDENLKKYPPIECD
jgi:hypothetical protein